VQIDDSSGSSQAERDAMRYNIILVKFLFFWQKNLPTQRH